MGNMFKSHPVKRRYAIRISAAIKRPHLRESLHTSISDKAMKKTLTVALVLLCMQLGTMVEAGKAHVSVTNHLQQSLRVSCESGDDTLDPVTLQPSTVYAFSFKPNIWGNTMFRCTFEADAYGRTTFRVWQGWLWASRRIKCSNCDWAVTPNGFSCNGQYLYPWRPW